LGGRVGEQLHPDDQPRARCVVFCVVFWRRGVQGFGWWEAYVNWEPEAEIGGSKSAGRAIPGWTDLECLLGLLPYIV